MLEESKEITVSDGVVLNLSDKPENREKEEDDLLYLIAEIIVEILMREKNERNRIFKDQ